MSLDSLYKLVAGKDFVVLSDNDETMRWGKEPPLIETEEETEKIRKGPGVFLPITGGPLRHVSFRTNHFTALVESGAVLRLSDGRVQIMVPPAARQAIARLRGKLGLSVSEGLSSMRGKGSVILEGPRHTTLTLVSGAHPDYPGVKATIPLEELEALVREIIQKEDLRLCTRVGTAKTYGWVDIYPWDKAVMVRKIRTMAQGKVYYLGDGLNDLEAMRVPGVIPVVFSNSIPELHVLARGRGIIVDKPGPDGGVVEALQLIQKQQGGR